MDNQLNDDVAMHIPVFENGMTSLTYDELASSVTAQEYNGSLKKSKPVEHFNFISDVLRVILEAGFLGVVESIQASQNSSKRVMWQGETSECPVKYFLFEALIGKILITDMETEQVQMAIAFTYNDSGIQLGYGLNVKACMNMTIFQKTHFWTTYGNSDSKADYDNGMSALRGWMTNLNARFKADTEQARIMSTIMLDERKVHQLYGKLLEMAIRRNDEGAAIFSALNVTQTCAIVRYLNTEIKDKVGGKISGWDLLNAGTSVLKPSSVSADIKNLILINSQWVSFVAEELQSVDWADNEAAIEDFNNMNEDTVSEEIFN